MIKLKIKSPHALSVISFCMVLSACSGSGFDDLKIFMDEVMLRVVLAVLNQYRLSVLTGLLVMGRRY